MLGTYHSLIGRRGDGLPESWLLATTEASVSRYKKKQVSGAARGGELVHLVYLVVSFVWFDERERQDRPAHQIDYPEFAVLRFAVRDADAIL